MATRNIPLKNVAPEIMAWWLDPEHHKAPEMFKDSTENSENVDFRDAGNSQGKNYRTNIFSIEGIQSLALADSGDALCVTGTESVIDRVLKTVTILDQPLKKIQITAQYLELDTQDLKDFLPTDPKLSYSFWKVAVLNADFHARLDQLISMKKVQSEPARTITAVNGYGKSVTVYDKDKFIRSERGAGRQDIPRTHVSVRFTITPTYADNGNLTVEVSEPMEQISSNSDDPKGGALTYQVTSPVVMAEMSDGDTVIQYPDLSPHLSPLRKIPAQNIPQRTQALLMTFHVLSAEAPPKDGSKR